MHTIALMTTTLPLNLKYGFTFADLSNPLQLQQLDQLFLSHLKQHSTLLYEQLVTYRQNENLLNQGQKSEFLIHLAQILEDFLADFFSIQAALALSQAKTLALNPISAF